MPNCPACGFPAEQCAWWASRVGTQETVEPGEWDSAPVKQEGTDDV